jgi:hypothetical protein
MRQPVPGEGEAWVERSAPAGSTASVPGAPARLAKLHKVSRRHLELLTGELGILQHAIKSVPDPDHGYCVDDVARALEVDLLHARVLGWPAVSESAFRSLRFLEDAYDESIGRFNNFRAMDGSWIGGPGSNDSFGRAMLALGEAVGTAPDAEMVERAGVLFDKALPKAVRMTSPRAQASVVLGLAAMPTDPTRTIVMRTLGTDLHARFRSFARPGWPWPEPAVTYENGLLPRAMIVIGHRLGATTMLAIGLQVLDWLIEVQTAPDGHLSPIGNGWWAHDGTKSQFDQQPIEPTGLLLACEAAYAATGRGRYAAAMERCYAWFLGDNDLRVKVADPVRGAGRDGITPTGVNVNEGAESTLMWLIALEHIRALRAWMADTTRTPAAAAGATASEAVRIRPKTSLVSVGGQ